MFCPYPSAIHNRVNSKTSLFPKIGDSLPREHISGIELKYMMRTYQLEKDLIFPQRFLF